MSDLYNLDKDLLFYPSHVLSHNKTRVRVWVCMN